MTEQPAENAAGTVEAREAPLPKFSGGSEPADASKSGFDAKAFKQEIVAELGDLVERKVQGLKDKRLSALDRLGGVDELVRLKEYIKAQNGDVDRAVREFQIDQMLEQKATASLPAQGSAPDVDEAKVKQKTSEILTEAGIDFSDPEYVALAERTYRAPDDFYHQVNKLVAKRAKQARQPGIAEAAPAGGGQPPRTGDTQSKLEAKYTRLRELQLAPPSLDNRKERQALESEIKAAGGYV